jgi:hypothetical protein
MFSYVRQIIYYSALNAIKFGDIVREGKPLISQHFASAAGITKIIYPLSRRQAHCGMRFISWQRVNSMNYFYRVINA